MIYLFAQERDYKINRFMFVISRLLIKLTAKLVGKDDFGNCYYISKTALNSVGEPKRYVIYAKNNLDFSNVPPAWNLWLHYSIDIDEVGHPLHNWQKPYQSNTTGTNLRFIGTTANLDHKNIYQSWKPHQTITQDNH
jgi:NADH:ubiquinone oxidoreductase subunit